MFQELYVPKEEISQLPQWEDFVRQVYTDERSYEALVCELNDGFDFLTLRSEDGDIIVDAGSDPIYFSSNAKAVSAEEFIEAAAPYLLSQPVKVKRAKRKKGERNKAPTVNKATILFMSGETYTLKDFVSIKATAESVVFIMEDNWKGTVNYRQAITVPNDDVAEVKVRGVNHQFVLDMMLTNMGIVILQAEGAEIHSSSIDMVV